MSHNGKDAPVRVMVVDDSKSNRETIKALLSEERGVVVVAEAADGEEALREANRHLPEVITLDLQMPKMDGFTFLRILMGHRPTPVIVVSSYSDQHSVFRALEFGALDFVAKPSRSAAGLETIRQELLAKLMLVRRLQVSALTERRQVVLAGTEPKPQIEYSIDDNQPAGIVVIGASTGGPSAVQTLLAGLPPDLPLSYLVAQHMPEQFTGTFAERLNGQIALSVVEAVEGLRLTAGQVVIAKGGHHLRVQRDKGCLCVDLTVAAEGSRHVPSVDTLFFSAAKVMGKACLGIILTGMGDDGAQGVRALKKAGGSTLAESEETAIIYGMPCEATATGAVDKSCRLADLASEVAKFGRDFLRVE